MSLVEDLQSLIGGEVLADDDTLGRYSTDASIFEVKPSAVVYPKDVDDLQLLVHYATQNSTIERPISITPRGAGTCMSGGSLTEGIILDMTKYFSHVGDFNTEQKTVWVGSGTYHRDLEAAATAHNLLFAPYTSSKDLCVIGGMIGNNASGEKSLRYGATIDNVIALRLVTAAGKEYMLEPLNVEQLAEKQAKQDDEGELYRQIGTLIDENWDLLQSARPKVRKNAAGLGLWNIWDHDKQVFNLAKLVIGSQGTLGIVTSVKLQLVDLPKFTRMVIIPITDLGELAKAVKGTLLHQPEGMETYDHHTYDLAKEYMPEVATAAKSAEGQHMVLFAQFAEQTANRTDQTAKVCITALERAGLKAYYINDPVEQEAHWNIRRASFKLLKDHAHGTSKAVPFIEDTIVGVDHYSQFLAALEAILADYEMTYTYAGHIGDGSIRLIPLVDMEAEKAVEKVFDLARRTYDLVFAFGGSMSVDHNDGLIRTPFLENMYGEAVVDLFAQAKSIFDPKNIFNPGKKVNGSMAYSMSHTSRSNGTGKL